MAAPVVTCSADQVVSYDAGTQLIQLGATATNSPTDWQWTVLHVPPGSTADTGTKGDFVDGVAAVQNPQLLIDAAVDGGYCLQAAATNGDGTSDPNNAAAQQLIIVRTQDGALWLPPDYAYDWGEVYLNPTLRALEAATGGAPAAHAATHQSGGTDAVKLDDLAAPDDNTDLDATTGAHGLLPKLGGGTTNYLRADGTWAEPAGGGGGGGFDHAEYFTASASPLETFTISSAAATNANQPSGYSVRVYVNGVRHQWSASSPVAREFDVVSATQIRVGGLNISDNVEIEYGV